MEDRQHFEFSIPKRIDLLLKYPPNFQNICEFTNGANGINNCVFDSLRDGLIEFYKVNNSSAIKTLIKKCEDPYNIKDNFNIGRTDYVYLHMIGEVMEYICRDVPNIPNIHILIIYIDKRSNEIRDNMPSRPVFRLFSNNFSLAPYEYPITIISKDRHAIPIKFLNHVTGKTTSNMIQYILDTYFKSDRYEDIMEMIKTKK